MGRHFGELQVQIKVSTLLDVIPQVRFVLLHVNIDLPGSGSLQRRRGQELLVVTAFVPKEEWFNLSI